MNQRMKKCSLRAVLTAVTLAAAPAGLGTPAAAKKPPRTLGAPVVTDHYWDVTVSTARGKTTIVSAANHRSPMGARVVIHSHIGPMSLVLVGEKDRVLARRSFAWPLLGTAPDSDELGLAKGLTATVELRIPHIPGLRTLRVDDQEKKPVATKDEVRWPGEPDDAAPAPGEAPAEREEALKTQKREPRELVPAKPEK